MSKENSVIANSDDIKLLDVIPAEKLIKDWQQSFQIDITQELHGHDKISFIPVQSNSAQVFPTC